MNEGTGRRLVGTRRPVPASSSDPAPILAAPPSDEEELFEVINAALQATEHHLLLYRAVLQLVALARVSPLVLENYVISMAGNLTCHGLAPALVRRARRRGVGGLRSARRRRIRGVRFARRRRVGGVRSARRRRVGKTTWGGERGGDSQWRLLLNLLLCPLPGVHAGDGLRPPLRRFRRKTVGHARRLGTGKR